MKRLLLEFLSEFALALFCFAFIGAIGYAVAESQMEPAHVTIEQLEPHMADLALITSPRVMATAAASWDTMNVDQPERAGCLYLHRENAFGTPIVVLDSFAQVRIAGASPYHVSFQCPVGTYPIHVHTPTTCSAANVAVSSIMDRRVVRCRFGGEDAWECFPSGPDRANLTALGYAIGFLQCDQHAIIPFLPNGPVSDTLLTGAL